MFTEGFTVVCGSAVESFRERKLPYPIHCAPPPPPARFLQSLAGNWIARHRERSDVTVKHQQRRHKLSICTAAAAISHTLVIVATVSGLISCSYDFTQAVKSLPCLTPTAGEGYHFCQDNIARSEAFVRFHLRDKKVNS